MTLSPNILRSLVESMLDNEPDDIVADGGITMLQVWRHEAARALGREAASPLGGPIQTLDEQDSPKDDAALEGGRARP